MPPIFRKEPPLDIIVKVLEAFGLKGLGDASWFTKPHIRLDVLEPVLLDLEPYYMPCKAEIYLYNKLTPQRAVTILRQVLNARGIHLSTNERGSNGVKTIWYQIVSEKPSDVENLGHIEFN
jgi:hypothetical protein